MRPLHAALLLTAALFLSACSDSGTASAPAAPAADRHAAAAPVPDDYFASVQTWQREREERLRDPDGWLSFTGSGQVAPGRHRVGRDPDNAIVLPTGPGRLGVLELGDDGTLAFEAAPGSAATIDGAPFTRAALRTQLDGEDGPTHVEVGQTRFYVVRTGDRHGWRLRDRASPARLAFDGIERFPVDPSWRVVADWEPFDTPRQIELVSVIGTIDPAQVPGRATFERDGRRYTLLPVAEPGDDTLFFILADRTSGRQTYGGGRFLYAERPAGAGTLVLDFNRAQNPPCALNGHVVCPTPPPENRLDLAVTAGEKTYAAVH